MTGTTMSAWQVRVPGPMHSHPLQRVSIEVPRPAPAELLVAVHACGVCRTDLHVAEGCQLLRCEWSVVVGGVL